MAGGLNLYGFGESDPVNFDDPFGLCPECREDDPGARIRAGFWNRVLKGHYEACEFGANADCRPTPVALAVPNLIGGPAGRLRGFLSFAAFKRAHGSAGVGQHWHHIVGQTAENVERFGGDVIHSADNIIALEAGVHAKISGFYNSKQAFTGGQTVRGWLSNQAFQTQREFGMKVLRDFGVIR